MNIMLVYLALVVVLAALLLALSRQLGRPSGWFGRRVMGQLLNQSNKRFLDDAVQALAPASGERIVDVGFGGGYGLDLIREFARQAASRLAPGAPLLLECAPLQAAVLAAELAAAGWRAVQIHRDRFACERVVSANRGQQP